MRGTCHGLGTTFRWFAVCAMAAFLANVCVAQSNTPKQQPTDLLALDESARNAFAREHPNVLPELTRKLPGVNARTFNWVDHQGVGPAHQQKAGDCWANAVVQALECNWLLRNGRRIQMSPQPLLDRTQNTDHKGFSLGNSHRHACDLLLKHGTASFKNYPYTGKPGVFKSDVKTPYRIIAWGDVGGGGKAPTELQIKAALLRHGPLTVTILSTPALQKFRGNGVFAERTSSDGPKSNHVVLLVGWSDARGKKGAWRIRNSWAPSWGDNGYAWIEYGSNHVCHSAVWLRAQSIYYQVPSAGFARLVPEAASLIRWKSPLTNVH